MSYLCVPLKAKSLPALKKLIKLAERKADLVEVWLDALRGRWGLVSPQEILKYSKKPLIIVNRGKNERGEYAGSEAERIKILERYLRAGVRYLDVSVGTNRAMLRNLLKSKSKKTKIIFSHHDYRKTPSLKTLKKIRDGAFASGADIVKIATYANNLDDNLKIFRLLDDCTERRKPCIAFCMGKKGMVSRILAPRYGSYIIYTALDSRHKTAPGQLTLEQYDKISLLLQP